MSPGFLQTPLLGGTLGLDGGLDEDDGGFTDGGRVTGGAGLDGRLSSTPGADSMRILVPGITLEKSTGLIVLW